MTFKGYAQEIPAKIARLTHLVAPALLLSGQFLPATEVAPKPRSFLRITATQIFSALKNKFAKSASQSALPDARSIQGMLRAAVSD